MNGTTPVVATVGSIIIDLAVTTPRIPARGENILGTTFKMGPGGKGANASVAVSRLGAVSHLVGCVGSDEFAGFERDALVREGVRVDAVARDPQTHTGVAFIMVDDEGENTILVAMGANASLSADAALKGLAPLWESLDALLVNFEIPKEVVAAVVSEGARRGKLVVVDAGPPRSFGPDVWAGATVVSPNLLELQALGAATAGAEGDLDVDRACDLLRRSGPNAVVLKRGGEGAAIYGADGKTEVPAFAVEVVDTTGAGDAFTAALVVAMAEGLPIDEAARRGAAAGALAVTRFGTMPAMPTRRELEEFLAGVRQ